MSVRLCDVGTKIRSSPAKVFYRSTETRRCVFANVLLVYGFFRRTLTLVLDGHKLRWTFSKLLKNQALKLEGRNGFYE